MLREIRPPIGVRHAHNNNNSNNDNSNDNDFRGRTSTQWPLVYLIPRRFSKTKYVPKNP